MNLLNNLLNFKPLKRFFKSEFGNISLIVALSAVPVIVAGGVAIDYGRLTLAKSEFAGIADSVAMQAVNFSSNSVSASTAQTNATNNFKNLALSHPDVKLSALNVVVTQGANGRTSSVNYTISVPSTFTKLIGQTTETAAATSLATSAQAVFKDIYVLADNTPSMGLAATPAGVTALQNATTSLWDGSCAFACHIVGNTTQTDYYNVAVTKGIVLRIDTVRSAITSLLSSAANLNATSGGINPIRFALYTFGPTSVTNAATQISPLSTNMATAQTNATNNVKLMSVANTSGSKANATETNNTTTDDGTRTDFKTIFTGLSAVIPNGGDGSSQANSLKLVMFISDGVNDSNLTPCSQALTGTRCQEPIDVSLCTALKARGIEIGVLYTTYEPVTSNGWYNSYVLPYNAGPFSPSPNSVIAKNMKACASSGLYQEVGPNDNLTGALAAIFNSYLAANGRITG